MTIIIETDESLFMYNDEVIEHATPPQDGMIFGKPIVYITNDETDDAK